MMMQELEDLEKKALNHLDIGSKVHGGLKSKSKKVVPLIEDVPKKMLKRVRKNAS